VSESETSRVVILMGSESDRPIMQKAKEVLDRYGVPSELKVLSAHRLPGPLAEWARSAEEKGIDVVIAAAGMAAHLAGAVAANCILPVIGVPVASGALNGMDALLSTVQMPSGVPVATVAIDGAKNAAYLAIQILARKDPGLASKLKADRAAQQTRLLKGPS